MADNTTCTACGRPIPTTAFTGGYWKCPCGPSGASVQMAYPTGVVTMGTDEPMTVEQEAEGGPHITIKASCYGCRYERSVSYRCQGDSGHDIYCDHPTSGGRKIGDTRWDTPDWCPAVDMPAIHDARHRLAALASAPAGDAIILISQDDGVQTHGLFATFEEARAHAIKDGLHPTVQWVHTGTDRCEASDGEVFWTANREPFRCSAPAGAWRSFASAPKDETRIDVWAVFATSGARRVTDCYWSEEHGDWYIGQYRIGQYETPPQVTHWMPPPSPPGSAPAGDGVEAEARDLTTDVRKIVAAENAHARRTQVDRAAGRHEGSTTARDQVDTLYANLLLAWPAKRLDDLAAALARPRAAVPQGSDAAFFGASDAACTLYPGANQQAERAAFCEGAAHAVSSPRAAVDQCGKCRGSSHIQRGDSGECDACGGAGYHSPDTDSPSAAVGEQSREEIARIIDPEAWEYCDRLVRQGGPTPGRRAGCGDSLSKADAILALQSPTAKVEPIRESTNGGAE